MNDTKLSPDSCSSCKYWNREGVTQIHQGSCRRFPPQSSLIPTSNGQVANMTAFPGTEAGMNCGEFAPKLQS